MNNVQINFLDEQSSELDIQKAYELCRQVSHEIFGFNISIYGDLEEFFSKVKKGNLYVLTAKVEQEVSGIIGTLSFTPQGEQGTLDYFGVNQPFQGKGIGSIMYRTLESFLISRGHKKINLRAPYSGNCFEIYKKWGFIPKFRESDCRSLVLMTKQL